MTCWSRSTGSRRFPRGSGTTSAIARVVGHPRLGVLGAASPSRLELALPADTRVVALPVLLHWGRQDHAIGFYGCKLTPEDLQHAVLRVPALRGVMPPSSRSSPRGRRRPISASSCGSSCVRAAELVVTPELSAEWLLGRRLAESQPGLPRVDPAWFRPRGMPQAFVLFAHGTSPLGGQDARIKKRYVV